MAPPNVGLAPGIVVVRGGEAAAQGLSTRSITPATAEDRELGAILTLPLSARCSSTQRAERRELPRNRLAFAEEMTGVIRAEETRVVRGPRQALHAAPISCRQVKVM